MSDYVRHGVPDLHLDRCISCTLRLRMLAGGGEAMTCFSQAMIIIYADDKGHFLAWAPRNVHFTTSKGWIALLVDTLHV
jgi:hypothetical protein